MIVLRHHEGRYRPVILCDVCEQQITDATHGNVVSPHPEHGQVDLQALRHAHQGKCTDVAEAQLGGKVMTGFDNLDEHLFRLMYSVGLPPERLLEMKTQMEEHDLL